MKQVLAVFVVVLAGASALAYGQRARLEQQKERMFAETKTWIR